MKPSERLKELVKKDIENNPKNSAVNNCINAITDYLDEEWEKNKPCEHINTKKVMGNDHCLDCGLMGILK